MRRSASRFPRRRRGRHPHGSDEENVAEVHIAVTRPGIFSAEEAADVGIDLCTPVVEAVGSEARSRFAGRISKVTIDVK